MTRRSPRTELAIARAKNRAYRDALTGTKGSLIPSRPDGQPARFVQCWAVSRGYSSITQALDEDGQVWERVSLLENKILVDAWWEPVSMTRKPPRSADALRTPRPATSP